MSYNNRGSDRFVRNSPNYRSNRYQRSGGEDRRRNQYYSQQRPRRPSHVFHSPQRNPRRDYHGYHRHEERNYPRYEDQRYRQHDRPRRHHHHHHHHPQPPPPPPPPVIARRESHGRNSRRNDFRQQQQQQRDFSFQPNEEEVRLGEKRKRNSTPPGSSRPKKKRKIMEYTPQELEIRKDHFASTLSVIDRQKFEREFDCKTLNLSREYQKVYDDNPHIRQVFANRREFIQSPRKFLPTDRNLSLSASPKQKYQSRRGEAKTVDHWGQRKLLMSEIEFLTMFSNKEYNLVIYAGAAPGTHTNFLSELFPELRFVLVDPADFKAHETDRIKIIQDFFTDEMAKKYSKEKTVFISDIRSMTREMNENDKTRCVLRDMAMQRKWFNIMKPYAALFKLRFPYTKGKTSYLKGQIFAPCWGPRTTTETRLVVTNNENNAIWPAEEEVYDHTEYEDMMFYFNTVTRTTYFPHDFGYNESEGFCHCFDCNSEIRILKNYIKKVKKIPEFLSSKPISDDNDEEEEEGEGGGGDDEQEKIESAHMKQEVIKMSKLISRKMTLTGKRDLTLESALKFRYWGFSKHMANQGGRQKKRKKTAKLFKKRLQNGKDFHQIGRDEDEDDDDDDEEEEENN